MKLSGTLFAKGQSEMVANTALELKQSVQILLKSANSCFHEIKQVIDSQNHAETFKLFHASHSEHSQSNHQLSTFKR